MLLVGLGRPQCHHEDDARNEAPMASRACHQGPSRCERPRAVRGQHKPGSAVRTAGLRRGAVSGSRRDIILVELARGTSGDWVELGELRRQDVERLASLQQLRLLVLRMLMEYVEESEDLADEPLQPDSVHIVASAPQGQPTPLRASSRVSPADLVRSGALRSITVHVRHL